MTFFVRHDESLAQAGINEEQPITPHTVPAPRTTDECELERLPSHGWVGEDVRAAGSDDRRRVLGRLLDGRGQHRGERSGSPTGRPYATVARCGQKPAGLEPATAQLP